MPDNEMKPTADEIENVMLLATWQRPLVSAAHELRTPLSIGTAVLDAIDANGEIAKISRCGAHETGLWISFSALHGLMRLLSTFPIASI